MQRGALLFMNPALSGDASRSCATCHPGGGSNGLTYSDGAEVPAGSARGRNVPELRGAWQTPPYFWDGSVASVADALDRMLAVEMRGSPIGATDRDALVAYVLSIPPFDNGRVEPDGTPTEPVTLSARRGFSVFERAKCTVCHRPPSFSHTLRFDIGTDGKWSVPTLRNVSRTGPWGHDGRWDTLEDAVVAILEHRGVELDFVERQQLLRYLELL